MLWLLKKWTRILSTIVLFNQNSLMYTHTIHIKSSVIQSLKSRREILKEKKETNTFIKKTFYSGCLSELF